MHCWDAGHEVKITMSKRGMLWDLKPYGGWRWLGLAADLAAFALAPASTFWAAAQGMRAYARRRQVLLRPAAAPLAAALIPIPPSQPPD